MQRPATAAWSRPLPRRPAWAARRRPTWRWPIRPRQPKIRPPPLPPLPLRASAPPRWLARPTRMP
eukprot:8651926-Lingulodinium_polyedra.AAC.1